jgi:hypothetical protein
MWVGDGSDGKLLILLVGMVMYDDAWLLDNLGKMGDMYMRFTV